MQLIINRPHEIYNYCDALIGSAQYSLESQYHDRFLTSIMKRIALDHIRVMVESIRIFHHYYHPKVSFENY